MKPSTICRVAVLATAGALLASVPAKAAISYTNGDLLLGFRAAGGTGANTNYVVNIGQSSIYRDATGSFTLSVGALGVDLAAIYGSDWATRSDLFWGVIGGVSPTLGSDPSNTVYATKAESIFGTAETSWNRLSNSTQAGIVTKINTTAGTGLGGYLNGSTTYNSVALSNGFAVAEDQTASNPWAQYQFGFNSNTTGFGQYASPGIEGSFANGASGAALDLFRMQINPTAGTQGSYEGRFTISTGGVVSFSAPVPEPSSALMLGLGTSLLGAVRRRRQASVVA